MKRIQSVGRLFWLALASFALVLLIQGFRTSHVVSVLLDRTDRETVRKQAGERKPDALLAMVDQKDSLVVAATGAERNPFGDPPRPRRPRVERPQNQAPAPPPRPVEEKPPTLRTLLFDRVNPSVQLRDASRSSGWLHVGDTFDGWLVEEILENSVRISKGSRSVVLSAF